MKKVIILSDLGLDPCCVCASINLALFDKYEIIISFVPEDQLTTLSDDVYDSEVVVAIGYKNLYLKAEMMAALRSKLLFLADLGDEIRENDGKFVPILFPPSIDKETLEISGINPEIVELMGIIIEEVNGDKILDDSLGLNPDDLEKAEENIEEDCNYQANRYDRALKVIASLFGINKLIKFHELFLKEMITEQEDDWINKMIDNYEIMQKETDKLINKIEPLLHMPGIASVKTDNHFFFEGDILDAAEKLGYISLAIEYILENGNYETILMEKCSDEMTYLKGTIEENFNEVIANYN